MCLDRPEFKLKLDLLKETYNHNTLMYIYNFFFFHFYIYQVATSRAQKE